MDWCERHSHFHYMEEVARIVLKEQQIDRPKLHSFLNDTNDGSFFQLQQDIFDRQNTEEKKCEDYKYVIVDRGPDPLVFACQELGHEEALELSRSPSAKACLERYKDRNHVCVIMCPLDSIEDDGVRYVPTKEQQFEFVDILKNLLGQFDVPFEYCDRTGFIERLEWLEDVLTKYKLRF